MPEEENNLEEEIAEIAKGEARREINKIEINVPEIQLPEFKEIEFPEVQKVEVTNQTKIEIPKFPEVKIPEFPEEIKVKEPRWFSLQPILDSISRLSEKLGKVTVENPQKEITVVDSKGKPVDWKKMEQERTAIYGGTAHAVNLKKNDVGQTLVNPATEDLQDDILSELELKANLTETQPVSAASLPLPSGAATSAKQDSAIAELQKMIGFEIGEYDYIALTYVSGGDADGEIETVVYKTGGSGGSTVATLTLGYTVANLTSITKI